MMSVSDMDWYTNAGLVVLNVLVGFWADKISLRGPLVFLGGFFWWLFLLVNRLEVYNPK